MNPNALSAKLRVGLLGASGFTGKECLLWLGRHPNIELVTVMSARKDPALDPNPYPGAMQEPRATAYDPKALQGLDAVFVCTPHETAAKLVPDFIDSVRTTIDLSAAFRLRDPGLYQSFYGFEHPAVELLNERVYGLSEWARAELLGARLIANPGCYVSSVLLPLRALEEEDALAPETDIIADCKSGVSGAGKGLSSVTHFSSVHDDFRAYGVGSHRHEPEIRQELGSDRVYFTPHLLPVFRGILSTLHLAPKSGHDADSIREILKDRYACDPFIVVHEADQPLPCLAEVQRSNRCHLGTAQHGDRIVVVSCLDNLVKGAAGQAIQNFNLAFELDEEAGLSDGSQAPRGWR
ncbi:MAG: N-acetyl-gamma-glutamyl-phosphate reductase [Planctomycetota bacterium]|nr:MAG: N-acetyl-gamma-glutamyl-phosphate reductase [Planctomycetota bacterium]